MHLKNYFLETFFYLLLRASYIFSRLSYFWYSTINFALYCSETISIFTNLTFLTKIKSYIPLPWYVFNLAMMSLGSSYILLFRDGSGQNPTRGLFGQPEPTQTMILETRATRGVILSNPRDHNLTTLWFDMHYSTILPMIFACTAPPSMNLVKID